MLERTKCSQHGGNSSNMSCKKRIHTIHSVNTKLCTQTEDHARSLITAVIATQPGGCTPSDVQLVWFQSFILLKVSAAASGEICLFLLCRCSIRHPPNAEQQQQQRYQWQRKESVAGSADTV